MLQGELKGNLTNNVELKGKLTVGGIAPNLVEGNFTENGEYVPVNADGYSKAIVNVQPDLVEGNFTENGEYVPVNADGYSKATVNVQPNLIEGNFTENGEYVPVNADGYSKAIVNVVTKHPIVTAAAPFGYYEIATQYLYIDTYLEEGDTIVFAFTSRSNITLPAGVELIFKSTTSWNSLNQYLMFAKYTARVNESHHFEFIQANAWRFFCTYAIFHDVTVVHDTKYLTYYNDGSRTSFAVPDKNDGDILFWSVATALGPGTSGPDAIFTTTPNDLYRVSWPLGRDTKYPRIVSFLDVGDGATNRTFGSTNSVLVNNGAVIDALQIIPN